MSHLVIMAAGTGGHIIPGLAVAQEMLSRGWTVSWLGTREGMETRLVPAAGIALDSIGFSGLRGKGLLHTLTGGLRLLKAFWECLSLLKKRGADAVLGMGGYVCFPGGLMASLLGKPLLLVNADASLLLSNKALLPVADRIAFGFDGAAATTHKRAVVTGNPVRAGFLVAGAARPRAEAPGARAARVLVFGGSQGAHAINLAMMDAAPALARANVDVTHQTGPADLAAVRRAYEAAGLPGRVEPFFDEMDREMARADLVVCRAGATTLAEVTAAGRPALLVPLPTATDDHQRRNAEALVRAGAAEMLDQRDLTGASLAAAIQRLVDDPARRDHLAEHARALARPDAARAIAERILALAEGRR